jgi:hypothetical protein
VCVGQNFHIKTRAYRRADLALDATRADIAPMRPIALTDRQLAAIIAAAEPLAPADRSPFLAEVAAALQGQEIGDGMVHRACADAWTKFWHPPALERAKGQSKWR